MSLINFALLCLTDLEKYIYFIKRRLKEGLFMKFMSQIKKKDCHLTDKFLSYVTHELILMFYNVLRRTCEIVSWPYSFTLFFQKIINTF